MLRNALAEFMPRPVMIGHAGEGEQAERAKRQRQHHGIARPAHDMLSHARNRLGQAAFDRERQRLDMRAFALTAAPGRELARRRRLLPREIALLVEGMYAGKGDVRQRKIRIGRNRALQRLRRAGPPCEHEVHALAIGGCCLMRGGGE